VPVPVQQREPEPLPMDHHLGGRAASLGGQSHCPLPRLLHPLAHPSSLRSQELRLAKAHVPDRFPALDCHSAPSHWPQKKH